jgi:small-conductance mechanosensitive channel
MECLTAISRVNLLIIESKLEQSKEIQEKITNLEKSKTFLSEKEIDDELKKTEKLEQQLSRVSQEIMTLKKDKSYLDLNQIQSLEDQVSLPKKFGRI